LSIHDTLIANAAKNGNTQEVKNLIEEARASQLSFKSSWKSQQVADNEDNLGTYKGLTEDYDCDDIGLVRGGTLAYTSPECTRLSPAERYKSICTDLGGAVDLANDFAKAKGAQSLAALCEAKDKNTFHPIGPLTASGEVCGTAEIAAGACTATARAVESLAVCALAVRRYQTTQPGGWAADIGAVHYASGDICTDSPSTTAISCQGTCSGAPAACAAKKGDQVGCQAIAECTYTKPYRVAATRHCYAVPSGIDITADKYPSDKGPDTPTLPVADDTTLDVLGAGLYWLPSDCLDHWHGYPYAKSAGAGAQYYAISDPDGEVALTFGTVYIPRGDQVHQVAALDEWGARDKKTWMASDGNDNVWVSFKYRVSWQWNTGTWKQHAADTAHPANGATGTCSGKAELNCAAMNNLRAKCLAVAGCTYTNAHWHYEEAARVLPLMCDLNDKCEFSVKVVEAARRVTTDTDADGKGDTPIRGAHTAPGCIIGAATEPGTCTETAAASVLEDAVACAEVTGAALNDATACELVKTASETDAAATAACTYIDQCDKAELALVRVKSDGGGDADKDTDFTPWSVTSVGVETVPAPAGAADLTWFRGAAAEAPQKDVAINRDSKSRVTRRADGWVEHAVKLPGWWSSVTLQASAKSHDPNFIAWMDDVQVGAMGCMDPDAWSGAPREQADGAGALVPKNLGRSGLGGTCSDEDFNGNQDGCLAPAVLAPGVPARTYKTLKSAYTANNILDHNSQVPDGDLDYSSCSYEVSCWDAKATNYDEAGSAFTHRPKAGCFKAVSVKGGPAAYTKDFRSDLKVNPTAVTDRGSTEKQCTTKVEVVATSVRAWDPIGGGTCRTCALVHWDKETGVCDTLGGAVPAWTEVAELKKYGYTKQQQCEMDTDFVWWSGCSYGATYKSSVGQVEFDVLEIKKNSASALTALDDILLQLA